MQPLLRSVELATPKTLRISNCPTVPQMQSFCAYNRSTMFPFMTFGGLNFTLGSLNPYNPGEWHPANQTVINEFCTNTSSMVARPDVTLSKSPCTEPSRKHCRSIACTYYASEFGWRTPLAALAE
jgi:hypothetical protein